MAVVRTPAHSGVRTPVRWTRPEDCRARVSPRSPWRASSSWASRSPASGSRTARVRAARTRVWAGSSTAACSTRTRWASARVSASTTASGVSGGDSLVIVSAITRTCAVLICPAAAATRVSVSSGEIRVGQQGDRGLRAQLGLGRADVHQGPQPPGDRPYLRVRAGTGRGEPRLGRHPPVVGLHRRGRPATMSRRRGATSTVLHQPAPGRPPSTATTHLRPGVHRREQCGDARPGLPRRRTRPPRHRSVPPGRRRRLRRTRGSRSWSMIIEHVFECNRT